MGALFLAALGLFGALAHAVTRRTQELGVRLARGALPRDLLLMVMREGVRLTAAGIGLAIVGALLFTRIISGLLFGVSSTDSAVYSAIPALLLIVATLACHLPYAEPRLSIPWLRYGMTEIRRLNKPHAILTKPGKHLR